MPEKYFIVSPKVEYQSKEVTNQLLASKIDVSKSNWDKREDAAKKAMNKDCTLKHVEGKVILMVDIESKNRYTFSNGVTIRRERRYNNFNFREVNPTNAFVVSAANVPRGAEVLVDYTSMHDSYKIFDYDSGSPDVQFFSIREEDIFAWRVSNDEWKPMPNYEFGLHCYKPYEGNLVGIAPTFLKDVLFVTTGELKGKVVRTLRGCDYKIVFTNDEGKEGLLIRFRHSENPEYALEEVIAIADDLTKLYYDKKILVGISPHDAKTC